MNALLSPTNHEECIYALAAGGTATKQAIAVVRVSGGKSEEILEKLTKQDTPKPRFASLRKIFNSNSQVVDQALIIWMPGPGSYTGEDSFEVHLHGSEIVIEQVFSTLASLGARTALPGEFTKRAVLNSKMDLLQAEAVADLIESETQAQASQALNQLSGSLSDSCLAWAKSLRSLLSRSEAFIDFPEDVSSEAVDGLKVGVKKLITEISSVLVDNSGIAIRDGLSIALAGEPNAGKSTLFNALLNEDTAIVTPIAGTTRDVLSATLNLHGIKVRLTDTAGLRETDDIIEKEGIKRAYKELNNADLILHLAAPGQEWGSLNTETKVIKVRTKEDLLTNRNMEDGVITISASSEGGLEPLNQYFKTFLQKITPQSDKAIITRVRHKAALQNTLQHLETACSLSDEVLLGEELRLAMYSLGELTGQVDPEMILDSIFSEFCIGK